MTAISISRLVLALLAVVAAGGVVFAIQYVQREPSNDTSTATAAATSAKPAAPDQKSAALSAAQAEANALASTLGGSSSPPPQGDDGVPMFDVARVEPTGEAVIAGRAAPGASVELLRNGEPHDLTVADQSGQFVMVVPRLPSGTYDLTLRSRQKDGKQVTSKQSVAVVLEPKATDRPVVALMTPDKPTIVLSQPASPNSTAAAAVVVEAVEVDPGGKFHVSGQARPDTAVRLYLNESFVASVTTGADGRFAVTINEGVRPGSYRVRLDEVEAKSGAVRARAEVPFNVPDKVVTGSVPEPATASKRPEAGSTSQPQLAAAGNTVVPDSSRSTVVVPKITTTTVSRGDSLWRLSHATYGAGTRYAVIYNANKGQIRNPNLIYPGQVFVIPEQ
jgi:nucleoid-associated protein YgaU